MWAELEPRLFYAEKASNPLTKATKPGRRRERRWEEEFTHLLPNYSSLPFSFLHFLSVFRASILT